MNGQIDFPLVRPPTLNLGIPDQEPSILPTGHTEETRTRILPVSSSPVSVQWLDESPPGKDANFKFDQAAPYAHNQFQRIQHAISGPFPPVVEPLASISPNFARVPPVPPLLPRQVPGMAISTRGELLALWFFTWEIHVIDLRAVNRNCGQREHVICLDGKEQFRGQSHASNFWTCTCVEPFIYGEQDGFVLVFETERMVNVLFQPFHALNSEKESHSSSVVVGTFPMHPHASLTMTKVSGHWLALVQLEENNGETVHIVVINLTCGQRWSVNWSLSGGLPRDIAIINNEYVAVSVWGYPRHFRLLPNGEMHALDIDEVDLSLPPPLLASRSLSTNPITGQQYFSAWYEDASGVWCSEAELCSPLSSEPAPDSDICKPALHPQLPEARQAIRNIEKVTGSIPSSVFGHPDLWDSIARQWYERGTKRTLRGRLIDMLPQHKRGATQIHTTIINSLPVSPKGYSFTPQPQLLPDRSYPGDGRHCLSLACPFTATKHGLVEFPLEDRANIVLTQVVGGRQGNGGKRLKHELLMVRGSPQASNSQGVAGVSGFHDGVKPLVVRSGEVLVLWSTISGVVVIREPSLKGYHTMVYRFIQGAG